VERDRRALDLYRRVGHLDGQADVLNSLGDVEVRLGNYAEAADHLREALELYRDAGDRSGEAWTLYSLGNARTSLGRPDLAAAHERQAPALFKALGVRDGEAWALIALGEALVAAGRAPDQQARAHLGLAAAHDVLGNHAAATRHRRLALRLYTSSALPRQPTWRPPWTGDASSRSRRQDAGPLHRKWAVPSVTGPRAPEPSCFRMVPFPTVVLVGCLSYRRRGTSP
jgi:tetratricopeptide (TPR) repeat protein